LDIDASQGNLIRLAMLANPLILIRPQIPGKLITQVNPPISTHRMRLLPIAPRTQA